MGSIHCQIKIAYSNSNDARCFYDLLIVLDNGEINDLDSKLGFLKGRIANSVFAHLKEILFELWEHEDETPSFWDTPIQNGNEIYFELYGFNVRRLYNAITNLSLSLGIESYHRIDSTTKASGLGFYWIEKNNLHYYYADQSTFDIFKNWESSFDESVGFVKTKHSKQEIETTSCSLKEYPELGGKLDTYSIQEYLVEIGASHQSGQVRAGSEAAHPQQYAKRPLRKTGKETNIRRLFASKSSDKK